MGKDETAATMIMEEARRLLERQEADLDTLRNKTTITFTGTAIVVAVFGAAARAAKVPLSDCGPTIAIAAFGTSVLLALFVLWPRSWDFSHKLRKWIAKEQDGEYPTPEDVAVNFADYFETFRTNNALPLRQRQWAYAAICFLLGVQVVAWALAVL